MRHALIYDKRRKGFMQVRLFILRSYLFIPRTYLDFPFTIQEIFSSWTHKTEHFQKIQHKTRIPYESMLFFDDEDRNIEAVMFAFSFYN